ncbi:hypothetical protein ccbrp13_33920 [Ktedonobacteria bacterium brp13]|nr:hypothetical protein ccbrp13_33920 [Ktedonobacteria bacterium brp13]
MCNVCAQFQLVQCGCLKIFGDLSAIKKGEEYEGDNKDVIGIDSRLSHTERHTAYQKKHVAHPNMREEMNDIRLERRGSFAFFQHYGKQGFAREKATRPPQ